MAACASCVLCAVLVAGAAAGIQPGYTDVADGVATDAIGADVNVAENALSAGGGGALGLDPSSSGLDPSPSGLNASPLGLDAPVPGSDAAATSDPSGVVGSPESVFGQAGESEVVDALKSALAAKDGEEGRDSGGDGASALVSGTAGTAGASGASTSKKSGSAASSGKGAVSSSGNGAATSAQAQKKRCTITINGVSMDYVDSYGTSSAPSGDAGIWRGSDSTTDGGFGYFIGHNYTDFGAVANLETGNHVSVTDADGNFRDYEVVDSFTVPRNTTWSEVSDRVTGYGESIAMQTCANGGYVIVVAK